ncbi:AMP-binding protein [Micromonospora sp. RP3T]|uniref:AMP-binding protein n=1 Tax=Micromonospora sp. RP3T TaxID=2135446 RepID=UPI003D757C55
MSLLGWLDRPSPDRGVRIAQSDGAWQFSSYADLAEEARRAAGRLRSAGIAPGDTVIVVRSASADFVSDFFGALLAGATPAPVAPPSAFQNQARYAEHLAGAVRLARAPIVTTTAEAEAAVAAAVAGTGSRVTAHEPPGTASIAGPSTVPATAVLQFSSGSTGPPRGVRIPLHALESNMVAIRHRLDLTERDVVASWLPPYHDMGLVGMLLLPVSCQLDVWWMRPEDFVRSPLRWLRLFGPDGATVTGTPTFGLAQVLRRLRSPEQLRTLDLSGLRGIVTGAERVDAATVERFLELLAPFGMRPEAVIPAYGLAESTLAVTMAPCGVAPSTITVDAESLVPGQPVLAPADGGPGTALVGCGTPVAGVDVRIVDEDGDPVDENTLGEIEVRGTSLAAGVLSATDGEQRMGSHLRTGDAGFLRDGQLFVVGRIGDAVKQFGRWYFAEEAEQIARSHSPRPQQTVALIGTWEGRNTVVVLVEGLLDRAAGDVGRAVARHAAGLRVLVLSVVSGQIERTTSGKPRRRVMWQRLAEGRLHGTTRWDSDVAVGTLTP